MKVNIMSKDINTGSTYSITYNSVEKCPVCKHAIKPQTIYHSVHSNNNNENFFSVFCLCNACFNTFVTEYELFNHTSGPYTSNMLYSAPERFEPKQFEDLITTLSPQFIKIYNQALAAETTSLDEIAGLGYRKALEFLVKDYSISEFPEKESEIKSMSLSQCIKKYIDDHRIKTLVERSAWIGNDEAHYIKKQTDKDVTDMKSFINATLYFISMVLITKDAESMSPK